MLILHGENVLSSRKRLTEAIKSFQGEVIHYEGATLTLTEIKQAVESSSLFGQDRLVIIENLFSRRPSKEKEKILEYLKKNNPENLLIWEGKKIDGRSLIAFARAKIEKFTLPSIIFKFLDSLAPANQKNSLMLFHQCLEQQSAEMIFYMLVRHIRLLIIASDLGEKGLTRLASWQKMKFVHQAKKFGLKQLINLYRQLLQIDWQQKTSQTPFSLSSQLDLLITSL